MLKNVRFNVWFYAKSYGIFPTVDSCQCDSICGDKLCLDTITLTIIFRRFSNFRNTMVAPFYAAIAQKYRGFISKDQACHMSLHSII